MATTSPSQSAARRARVRRHVDRGEVEHEVRDHRADARAGDLGDDVDAGVAGRSAAEDAVGERDDRVEVGARDRAEGEDQRDEPGAGRDRVLEQLEPDVVGRQALGGDARADDDRDEERGADGLGASRRRARSRSHVGSAAASRRLGRRRAAQRVVAGLDGAQLARRGISTSASTV